MKILSAYVKLLKLQSFKSDNFPNQTILKVKGVKIQIRKKERKEKKKKIDVGSPFFHSPPDVTALIHVQSTNEN